MSVIAFRLFYVTVVVLFLLIYLKDSRGGGFSCLFTFLYVVSLWYWAHNVNDNYMFKGGVFYRLYQAFFGGEFLACFFGIMALFPICVVCVGLYDTFNQRK